MNIIIPLGGLGVKFKNEGYTKPKPLINILGKEMIFYVLDNINIKTDDVIYIGYIKELDKWLFDKIIKQRYDNIKLIQLPYQTKGAAETLLYCLNNIPNDRMSYKIVTLDCDNFYTVDILSIFRYQTHNSVFCFTDDQDQPIYSYVKVEQHNNVSKIIDIKEKEKISNLANTGCYCFATGFLLQEYCDKIIKNNIMEHNEYYISCVIKEMLNNDQFFYANIIEKENYHCLGTPLQVKIFCNTANTVQKPLIFCFDLDNVLVTQPTLNNNYTTVEPIYNNISICRRLKDLGHKIIINTSRTMKYNTEGKAIRDIGEITFNTLEKYEIPYDELYFGIPHADFYIGNKNINSCIDIDKEIGFYNTTVSERSFNKIDSSQFNTIIKKGINNTLNGEIHWYTNIPPAIKNMFPIFLRASNENMTYEIQQINGVTVTHQYLNEALNEDNLIRYLNNIELIHNSIQYDNTIHEDVNIYLNYNDKITQRYSNYNYQKYKDSDKIYKALIEYFTKYETSENGTICPIHGDPVFSNCIIDNYQCYKFIDMRGKQGNTLTIFGDKWYDYGKIYQSLIGYDEILQDKIISYMYKQKLKSAFEKYVIDKYGIEILNMIKMITNSLLFTLLPLHDNDKCDKYYTLINIS